MNGIFRDRHGDLTMLAGISIIVLICLVIIGIITGIIAGCNIAWAEGVETTITGTIQLHQLKYDKFWNYHYTNCEMKTYSGDTHHIQVIGHVELTYGKTYRIKSVVVNYWAHLLLVSEVVEITEIKN